MIENKGVLLGDFPDKRRDYGAEESAAAPAVARWTRSVAGVMPAIHRRCGQHCGQPADAAPQAANLLGPRFIALTLGRRKPLQINDLHDDDNAVTAVLAVRPLIGEVVEFSHSGFARIAHG
jgi:hypothetical protein